MNKKGEMEQMGYIIMAFVAIIVAIALFTASLGNIGPSINTNNIVNQSITFPAVGNNVTLQGQAATIIRITNASNDVAPATNYTVNNYVLSNGVLITTLTGKGGSYNGNLTNVTYTSEPFGYETSAGGRSVIGLIAIFAALAIAVIALVPAFKNNLLDLLGK